MLGFAILIYILSRRGEYPLIPWLSNGEEQGFIIFLTAFLMVFAVDVFLLEHCRTRSKFMFSRFKSSKESSAPYYVLNSKQGDDIDLETSQHGDQ